MWSFHERGNTFFMQLCILGVDFSMLKSYHGSRITEISFSAMTGTNRNKSPYREQLYGERLQKTPGVSPPSGSLNERPVPPVDGPDTGKKSGTAEIMLI